MGVFPVFFEGLALPGKDGCAANCQRSGGVILGRVDIATHPANLRAQGLKGFDEHGRLDCHVQAAGNARAFKRLARRVFAADGHQSGHLVLRDGNLFSTPVRE